MNSQLEEAIKTGTLAGAYLLEGSGGSVAAEMEEFVGRLFCEKKTFCRECSSCKKILAGYHPDVLRVSGSGSIKVADVTDVAGWMARKSYEGGFKAVLIGQAHTMVEAAQNKLLKSIEEPPERSVFLLGVDSRKNILPTILSRCIIIRMSGYNHEKTIAELKEKLDISTINAAALARAANYDRYAAAELAERKYLDTREDALRVVRRLLFAKNMAVSVMMDIIMNNADNLDDFFLAMQSYVRDILVYKNTREDSLMINADKMVDIQECAAALPDKKLVNTLQLMQETEVKRKLCTGILKKLLMEDMLFKILEVILG